MSEDSFKHRPDALFAALSSGAADWADARVPELLAWIRSGQRRSELQRSLRSAVALQALTAAHARGLLELLGDWGMLEAARAVSALPQLQADPDIAAQRARLAMQARDYCAAIAASEVAISALLQPGLSIDEFLRLCVAGAPAEGMLRFERQVLGSRVQLSERLALRWEALHRAGMSREASVMQLMCQRYFPERASVWASAGNHALDADDLSGAEAYFERCLQLDPQWTAGLAGLAIVCERRKDWAAALPYRLRVVEVERAQERDDAASLQRRLRYAAALARLERWREAEPLFRAAARATALAQLPAEQPVLVRVFSQNLYAPALVAALHGGAVKTAAHSERTVAERPPIGDANSERAVIHSPGADVEAPAISLAQHEAALLEQLAFAVRERKSDPSEQRWALALCAYLAGELERAYELLDQAEVDRPDDVALHYLLWRCASAIAHPQTASIRSFAEQAARAAQATLDAQSELQRCYAAVLVPGTGEQPAPSAERAQLAPQLAAAGEHGAGLPLVAAGAEELGPVDGPLLSQLERVAGFRALFEAAGGLPLTAAAASSLALAALLESLTSS